MKQNYLLFSLALTVLLSVTNDIWAQKSTFKNGPSLVDTNGNVIHAHGVGIIKVGSTYYMIGEDRRNIYSFKGVNMYSSEDLVNWKFENTIISTETHPDLSSKKRFIERPKIIYSPEIDEYVVWVHWESSNYGAAQAAVFKSKTITGDYTFVRNMRPNKKMARDCNLFVDDDGKAYFIAAGDENVTLYLHELTSDFLDITGKFWKLFPKKRREAPVIFKDNGIYYMLTSGLSGWSPNQGAYATASSITGPWSPLKRLGNSTTWNTQPANIISVTGTNKTTWIYVGDRWQDPNLVMSKNIFLPLSVGDGKVTLDYVHEWSIDMTTGEWRSEDSNQYISKLDWKIVSVSSEETQKEQRQAVNAIDGDLNTFWHSNYSDGAKHPHELIIDMGKFYDVNGFAYVPRQDGNASGLLETFQLFLSTDGNNWGDPVAGGWISQQADIGFKTTEARFVKFVSRSSFRKNAHVTIAEFNLFTNSSCTSEVTLNYMIDGEAQLEEPVLGELDIALKNGQDLKLKVGNDYKYGSTIWTGPNEFYNSTAERDSKAREANKNSFDPKDAGRYVLTYLDERQCSSIGVFNVTSNGCAPSPLTSRYSVNGGKFKTGKTINVHLGDKIELAPQPDNGLWSWSGCGVSREERKLTIEPTSSCTLKAVFTNNCGEKSSVEVKVNVKTGSGLGGVYRIMNRKSSKCLRPLDASVLEGTKVVQYEKEDIATEEWKAIEIETGIYTIEHKESGLVLDIEGASKDKGAKNIIWSGTGDDNQKWRLIDQGGDYFHIKNVNSGLLLDISGGSTANNAFNIQWKDNGGHNQDWLLMAVKNGETELLSVKQKDAQEHVFLYPNPVRDVIHIDLGEAFLSEAKVQILNSFGQIELQKKLNNEHILRIGIEELETGVHVLKVTGRDKSVTKRFLKVK